MLLSRRYSGTAVCLVAEDPLANMHAPTGSDLLEGLFSASQSSRYEAHLRLLHCIPWVTFPQLFSWARWLYFRLLVSTKAIWYLI